MLWWRYYKKKKIIRETKAGKKRMRQVGRVEVPQEAFLAVLKLDLEKGPHLHTTTVYGSIFFRLSSIIRNG